MAQINLYIPEHNDLLERLRQAATAEGASVNEFVLDLVEHYLEDYQAFLARMRVARAAERERLASAHREREQARLQQLIARAIRYGAICLINADWVSAHGLDLDVSSLPLAPPWTDDPVLAPLVTSILAPTGGYLLTQEQFMEILIAVGDFTLEAANNTRRQIAKRQPQQTAAAGKLFITGAVAQGADESAAAELFRRIVRDDWEDFPE